jgi:hypothetical protein
MATSAFVAQHGNHAGRHADNAYKDVEARYDQEDGVNRRHRNAEHNRCVARHVICCPPSLCA